MRWLSLFLTLSCLSLGGCGVGSMFDGPAADMTALPPPGAGPDRGDHHRRRPHPSGMSYADDAPVMPMPPGGMSEDSRPRDTSGPSSEGVSFGTGGAGGNTADITPRPSVPDTEVSYGQNSGN
ncbi:hypothetical protein MKW11_04140 [Gluconobacter frateurii]|uniref:hypothetical protein n=1 Tax=Gluconobacter frateurii TaxID=38308 RepID=UPI0007C7F9E4|nr:hypothetical protein [Gluconobacter frateurii]UMM09265.1 hypothetical protein MKW11_04140 [Gluconobacter frateurii]